jgi:DNA-binding MarR family transcriptional regulator
MLSLQAQPLLRKVSVVSVSRQARPAPTAFGAGAAHLTEELGMLIGRTRRMVWTNASRRLEARGESMLAWQLLGDLVRSGKRTQIELSQAVAQHPAGVSRLLDELEKGGYVSRSRDPGDRRCVHVMASPRGKRRYRAALDEVMSAVDHALEPLSAAERQRLRDLLRKIVSEGDECRAVPKSG